VAAMWRVPGETPSPLVHILSCSPENLVSKAAQIPIMDPIRPNAFFPNELYQIVAKFSSPATLRSLCFVSRATCAAAAPQLYFHIDVHERDQYDGRVELLLTRLVDNPALANRVGYLALQWTSATDVSLFLPALSSMSNLWHLGILELGMLISANNSLITVIASLPQLTSIDLLANNTDILLAHLRPMKRVKYRAFGNRSKELERLLIRSCNTLEHLSLNNYPFDDFIAEHTGHV